MTEQQKIFRVLNLIKLLAVKPRKTIPELASILEVSKDTVYRYVNLLGDLGYPIDKNEYNSYFIFEPTEPASATFELEELELLNQLISTIHQDHPLRTSLHQKVFLSSPLLPLAEELIDKHAAKLISRLNTAITNRQQTRIIKYHSPASDSIRDRLVEPICLVKANSQLCAFDLESNSIKHFKVKRMSDVEVLDISATHSQETTPTDIFGFTSACPFIVKLHLTKRAHRLLIEEFPDAKMHISFHENHAMPYRFVCEIRDEIGIGRFILGLPGEIEVVSPVELVDYLNKRVSQFSFAEVATERI